MDLEQARLAAKALEDLKLGTDIGRIGGGLLSKKPSAKLAMIRAAGLKIKLNRAIRLVEELNAMLR